MGSKKFWDTAKPFLTSTHNENIAIKIKDKSITNENKLKPSTLTKIILSNILQKKM